MKLLRHGPKGQEKPAQLDAQGRVRDLSGVLADITPATLSPAGLAALRRLDPAALPEVPQGRLGVPWTGMGKFLGIGLNYADHAAESGLPVPKGTYSRGSEAGRSQVRPAVRARVVLR